jgi:hypothetical protein
MQQCKAAAEEQLHDPSPLESNFLLPGSGGQRLERLEVPETARIGIRRACDW